LDNWKHEPVPEVYTTKMVDGKFVTEGYLEDE